MTAVSVPTPTIPRQRLTPDEIRTPDGAQQRILLAAPRGYCAGVDRAVVAVERALEHYDETIYVRHEIVHNKFVVDRLKEKGAVFVEEVDEIPEGSLVIFSAHGISPKVREMAEERNLRTIDATCPLVTKVHKEAVRFARQDYDILLVGHEEIGRASCRERV